jgi:hypothetical protein
MFRNVIKLLESKQKSEQMTQKRTRETGWARPPSNMVLSVEPGLYVPGLAGFLHSDTVVVRKVGVERLTYYPRDLGSLTVQL